MNNLIDRLAAVAVSVGIESNNPEGGIAHDLPDDDIIECIVDIARGAPHKLPISQDDLTDTQRDYIIYSFFKGAQAA